MAPLAVLVAAGAGGWFVGPEGQRITATEEPALDWDRDGLPDALEYVIGTSPFLTDTDFDGFNDLEEFARKTSPIYPQGQPQPGQTLAIGMSCYARGGTLRLVVAAWAADGQPGSKRVQVGHQGLRGSLIPLSDAMLAQAGTRHIYPGSTPGARVGVIEVEIDPVIVHQLGQMTFYSTIADGRGGPIVDAHALQLLSIDRMIVMRVTDPHAGFGPQLTQGSARAGSIYVPLPGAGGSDGGSMPSGWSPGQICFQRTAPVGASGATVIKEVVSAGCEDGWDSFCPPSCASSVGSTFQTVDPLVLIGG